MATINIKRIKNAVRQVIAEKDEIGIYPMVIPPLVEQTTPAKPIILTIKVVESLIRHKRYEGLKDSSIKTYIKNSMRFVSKYRYLPSDTDTVLDYLEQFEGGTGRFKRNQHDCVNMLYNHAVDFFDFPENPLDGITRPKADEKPISTLTLEEVASLDTTPETTTERAAWEILLGHGWRPVEGRRILAGDVRRAKDNIIWCRGKERDEDAPILSETLALLSELTPSTLPDDQPVLRSRRIRNGSTQPLGEDGMSQLINRLYRRAGIEIMGYDLRRSYCTLIRHASGDEILAMRLIRDKVPGYNDRYVNYTLPFLVAALNRYSPLRLIKQQPPAKKVGEYTGESLVETGESRTPRPEEAVQNILQA